MKKRPDAMRAAEDVTFDVCVIGGGATGAGCALDAQLRGLKTVLLDAGDFASATSSTSTKLVHGGVRYLQQAIADLDLGQFNVVKRALHERRLMLDNAPFLAHPLELLVPCYSRTEVLYYRIGMKLYDLIAGRGNLFPSRYRTVKESVERMPMLNPAGLVGTVAYGDGQFDDTAYDIAILQTFSAAGGETLNYARVVGLRKGPGGKLAEVEVEDQFSHRRFTVRARAFVNATGPFSDHVREMAKPGIPHRLRLSKGVHILLPLDSDETKDAILIPKTEDGRVIFAIPWLGRFLVGTTDDEAQLGDEMIVTRAEAEYLLRHLNRYLVKPLGIEQIVSGIAGVRPLVASSDARNTKKLIREHEVEFDSESGLISILGGKWTTHRAMAEDTINAVQRYLGLAVTASPTVRYPLSGSEGYNSEYGTTLAKHYGIPSGTAEHLAEKFGTNAPRVLEIAEQDARWKSPIVPGLAPIQAEIVYSVQQTMAMTIEDVLARRVGLQLYSWPASVTAAPVVGLVLAELLNWSTTEKQHRVEEYVNKIAHLMKSIGLVPQLINA